MPESLTREGRARVLRDLVPGRSAVRVLLVRAVLRVALEVRVLLEVPVVLEAEEMEWEAPAELVVL